MSERFPDEVLKRAYVACDYALLSSVATDWADGLAAMRAVLEEHLESLDRPPVGCDCGTPWIDVQAHASDCAWRQTSERST